MTCRSCSEARQSTKASLKAIARGNLREGAVRAKEAVGHVRDKLKGEHADTPASAPPDSEHQGAEG